jgi:hypothetical protein
VISAEYQQLWPTFVAAAKTDDGLAFASTESWAGDQELSLTCGDTPNGIAAKPLIWPAGVDPSNAPVNTLDSYPPEWPFEAPFKQSNS